MSYFIDTLNYYFKLEAKVDGMYIKSEIEDVKLDFPTLEYFLGNYTIQKGIFSNGFRKIMCNDGQIRFFNKEHPEYQEALLNEKISPKDITEGTVLSDKSGREYIFLGFFYTNYRKNERSRILCFYNKTGGFTSYTKLENMIKIIGMDSSLTDRLENYNHFNLNKNGLFLTKSDTY